MALVSRHPISHWSVLVEGCGASPLECYTSLEEAIRRRKIPDVRTTRVWFREGGILSAKRLYLRVSRKRLGFDICAAPFGTGFFFSWRLRELPPSNFLGCLATLLVLGSIGFVLYLLMEIRRAAETPSAFSEILILGMLVFLTPWVVRKAVRKGSLLSEDAVLSMPLIGALYDFLFRPSTYYKLDTIATYQKAVHGAVLEVVHEVRRAQGLRALAPASAFPKGFLTKPIDTRNPRVRRQRTPGRV